MKKSYTLSQFLLNRYIIFSTLFQLFKWYSLLHTSISHLLVLRVTWCNSDITKQSSQILNSTLACVQAPGKDHSCPQRSRFFYLASTKSRSLRIRLRSQATRIATSRKVQHRKSAIHGLPVTLRMLRVSLTNLIGWEYESNSLRILRKSDPARGRDSWCWPKGEWPLETRMFYDRQLGVGHPCVA